MGLGYNNQGYPVAQIFNSYGSGLRQVSKDYVITAHPNLLPSDSFYMVGHYKAFLINYSTNTLAFGFRNDFPSAPSQMKAGMLYLFAHSNGCITTLPGPPGTPGGGCLLPQVAPTPKYRVVYPHSGSTSSQDVTDGYTIMK